MKINLNALASKIARRDNPKGFNSSVIDAETTLANLGREFRSVGKFQALRTFLAIYNRAGK